MHFETSKLKTLLFNNPIPIPTSLAASTLNNIHHSHLTVCLDLWILTPAIDFVLAKRL